jgi:hypothetical protein|eukprot:COSAG03_NODE_4421_length_1558_cov_1.725154_2_plen_66_part_00
MHIEMTSPTLFHIGPLASFARDGAPTPCQRPVAAEPGHGHIVKLGVKSAGAGGEEGSSLRANRIA